MELVRAVRDPFSKERNEITLRTTVNSKDSTAFIWTILVRGEALFCVSSSEKSKRRTEERATRNIRLVQKSRYTVQRKGSNAACIIAVYGFQVSQTLERSIESCTAACTSFLIANNRYNLHLYTLCTLTSIRRRRRCPNFLLASRSWKKEHEVSNTIIGKTGQHTMIPTAMARTVPITLMKSI